MAETINMERPVIFVNINYLSPRQAGLYKMPGELLVDQTPYRGYWRKLYNNYKKKFTSIEVSIPRNLNKEKIYELMHLLVDTFKFGELPYKASFLRKGNSTTMHFYLCEFLYYKEEKEFPYKRVFIDSEGRFCKADTEGAREHFLTRKSHLSKRHSLFKSKTSHFVAQINRIKQEIYEKAKQIGIVYDYGVRLKKLRYKTLPKRKVIKAKLLNSALKMIDDWLDNLYSLVCDLQKSPKPLGFTLKQINHAITYQRFKMKKGKAIKIFSSSESCEAFIEHCNLFIKECQYQIFPETRKGRLPISNFALV